MSARKRKHDPACKAKVALAALREEATVAQLAARSGSIATTSMLGKGDGAGGALGVRRSSGAERWAQRT